MLCFDFKNGISKMKNTLHNILENQKFQRIAKFIMADFYEMDFINLLVEK